MQIFDLTKRNIRPDAKDKYFLDTNIWYWCTYCGSKVFSTIKQPAPYQLSYYPAFVERIQDEGAKIYHCPLTYTELANIIENAEYEEYLSKQSSKISKKEYRKINNEREKVVKEIDTAWRTINSMSECLELKLDNETIKATHNFLSSSQLDAYDAIFIHFMKSHDLKMLVSDDHDLASAEIEQLFTANRSVLKK
ncbi:hypothetical protein [Acinetobacter tandoii]|uniref:hypothetical protein n=1 Tax=Acinetobacter tandoii TaxID=202954 RepID=UPI00301A618F